MKKRKILTLALTISLAATFAVLTIICFKPKAEKLAYVFYEWFFKEGQNEESRTEKYGSVGKDTIYVFGDGKFQIMKLDYSKDLIMHYDDGKSEVSIISLITKYKEKDGKLYVMSELGYGVVGKEENRCRIYIKSSAKDSVKRLENDECVKYLDSYDDFSEEERAIFYKMKNPFLKRVKKVLYML